MLTSASYTLPTPLPCCSYLLGQINEGAGKEIRCPGHQCHKVVPDVSQQLLGVSFPGFLRVHVVWKPGNEFRLHALV